MLCLKNRWNDLFCLKNRWTDLLCLTNRWNDLLLCLKNRWNDLLCLKNRSCPGEVVSACMLKQTDGFSSLIKVFATLCPFSRVMST